MYGLSLVFWGISELPHVEGELRPVIAAFQALALLILQEIRTCYGALYSTVRAQVGLNHFSNNQHIFRTDREGLLTRVGTIGPVFDSCEIGTKGAFALKFVPCFFKRSASCLLSASDRMLASQKSL